MKTNYTNEQMKDKGVAMSIAEQLKQDVEPEMTTVELQTADGGKVAQIDVPPFKVRPEGIRWGDRYFFKTRTHSVYVEGLMYYAPTAENTPEV